MHHTILAWLSEHSSSLEPNHVEYLETKLEETSSDPFGYFYLLYKLHKTPVKTRPVCSDCASLTHALGKWVNKMLQPMVVAQDTHIRDSFALKKELQELRVPPNASILSFDAVSMYTKIDLKD